MKYSVDYLLFAFLVTVPSAGAQNASAPLTFEAASVKEAAGPGGVNGGCHGIDSAYSPQQRAEAPPLGRCVITDARLSHLIGIAYGVSMLNLKTGPDWIQRGDLRFNIEAKAENPTKTTEQQLFTMLQNMLVERFQIKFHLETSETSGFGLLVGKNGPKLQVSKSDETKLTFNGPDGRALGKPFPGQPISMTASKVSIPNLLSVLTALGGHGPGVDKTGSPKNTISRSPGMNKPGLIFPPLFATNSGCEWRRRKCRCLYSSLTRHRNPPQTSH